VQIVVEFVEAFMNGRRSPAPSCFASSGNADPQFGMWKSFDFAYEILMVTLRGTESNS
jgi:hypothetical protein